MRLHYDEEGDGPAVVLLHGFPEFRRSWRKQLPALAAAGFRAVAPDLRGYGRSPKPRGAEQYRVPLLVDDVAELIVTVTGGGPCVLVGHDWGGLVAWFTAMTRPELVEKLAIINCPHPAVYARELRRNRHQQMRSFYQLLFRIPILPEIGFRLFGRSLMRFLGRFTKEELDEYSRAWRGSLRPMFDYYRALRLTRGELRPLMRRIDAPVLIIWGEDEPVFLPETLNGTEEWAPDLRIERVPGIGHFVQHDAPERVNELLIRFAATRATPATDRSRS